MIKTRTYLLATLVFDTAIAGVLSVLRSDVPFSLNFVFAQCIGLSILAINLLIIQKTRSGLRQIAALSLALPLGVAMGVMLALSLTGIDGGNTPHVGQAVVVGLFFGLIGIITVLLTERIATEVQLRELAKSEGERREIEAHLKLLQAQIEPHFLFNTLANVGSLIDGDPALAKDLLDHLNDWLHGALARARSDRTTLGDELDMLENYLKIMKIRFGERLCWRIEAAQEARRMRFPPMLLQPLLENAMRHGIEPKLGGGEIRIYGRIDDTRLRLEVVDNGMGLAGQTATAGAGLANVRARLESLFGDAGILTLNGNTAGGTTATLVLPKQESSL